MADACNSVCCISWVDFVGIVIYIKMDSKIVLDWFREITRIPRESGHEEQITAYLQQFAREHSLESQTDEAGNVVIIKPASKGCENRPVIVLQSHSDMVCEKNSGVEHDFSKDPINYVIEDGWMIAKDTTLGADCGIGMAAQLAVLTGNEETGRIECLFTVSEETGLYGAKALKPGFITGGILINLDSEDEGELFVGCAGGVDTTAVFRYSEVPVPAGTKLARIKVSGGIGGHSGDDIDKGRANAVQLLARFLYSHPELRLCSIEGGNKRNAIAREAAASVAVPDADVESLKTAVMAFGTDLKSEYASSDPDICVEASVEEMPAGLQAIESGVASALVASLFAAPHGVLAMSMDIPGLVETSTNLASVKMPEKGVIRVGTSQRSSVDTERLAAGLKVEAAFRLAGAEVTHESEYPGWKPNMDSALLKVCEESYMRLFGKKPVVRAIHAGLECGLFLDTFPGLDMISFGPTLRGVHAPGERLDLASLDKFVALLEDVIVNIR